MPISPTSRLKRRRIGLAGAAGAVLVVAAISLGVQPASANDIATYTGTTSGTASTIVLHQGDAYERTLNPSASASATVDLTTGLITSASTSFDAAYSDTFAGPFGFWLYVGAQLEQVGAATGTATPTADPAVRNVVLNITNRLRVVVYRVQPNQPDPPNPQNPATDQKLTLATRCWVDIPMVLTGTINSTTGALQLAQNPFTIPNFPGDPGDAANPGGTADHRCQTATSALNQQLAGPNNSVSLGFAGTLATTTTTTAPTTTSSTTSSTTTSTTAPTTTTSSTTSSTTAPTTTSSTSTSTTAPTTTSTTAPTTTSSTTAPVTSSTTSSTIPSTSIAPGSTSTTSDVLGGNVNNNNGGGNGTGSSGASNGTLPRTGSDSLPLAAFGTALIVAGGVVLLRRRTLHGT